MKPRPSPRLERSALRAAFEAARFDDVTDALDAAASPAPVWAEILRARIELKRTPAAALDRLAAASRRAGDDAERAEIALVEGIAFARLRDARSAAARFRAAERLDGERSPLALELAYQRAADRWIQRRDDALEGLPPAGTAPMPLALEIEILRGAVAASNGDLRSQAAILLDARERVAAPERCALAHAVLASQLATLAREMPSAALRDAAAAEIDRVRWTSALGDFRFVALRSLGFRHALDGNDFDAFRRLKASADAAPSEAWRVMALCDRAYLARSFGEPRWSAQELGDARDLAERIDWQAISGEERHALLLLAELCAERDAPLALTYLTKYRGIGRAYDAALAAAGDRRLEALEAFSFGVVRVALGDTAEGVARLETAWSVYEAIGYGWRAARAASQLAAATGDAAWQRRAATAAKAYPASWLAHPVAEHPAAERLTPAQREVYEHLLRGRSAAAIASEQGRSLFTIRNHIKVILKTFDVQSIAALIAAERRPRT